MVEHDLLAIFLEYDDFAGSPGSDDARVLAAAGGG